ncbi:MAG: DNA repair and recombination protein RadA [Candidatus Nezhaarchaeota archaeon]|nr:DNA repair and recombination protein RadA [Candidatus Nezhaarchaeota archaeon]
MSLGLKDIPGVGEKTLKKLEKAGITSPRQLALMTAYELASVAEIGEHQALAITEAARRELERVLGIGVVKAREHYEKLLKQRKLTTGCRSLDSILDGGLEPAAITEFVGVYGSGKSQIMHQLCVTVQLPEDQGGLGGRAFYIDTERGFSPRRLVSIASRFKLSPEGVLDNVYSVYVVNTDHQVALLDEVERLVSSEGVRLVVIDSFTSHFRKEYPGRDHLAERQQKLNRYLGQLLKIAVTYDVVAAVTNQVMASPDPREPGERAVGGNVMGHGTTHRVWLWRRKGSKRLAKIIDSPRLPEAEAWFEIGEGGVYDTEPEK